jgi:putative oxidoreductase
MDQMFSKWQPTALSLFRFVTGLLLFQYGVAKIFKFPALPYFANPPPLIMGAGAIELVLGALLMSGLFTHLRVHPGGRDDSPSPGHMFKSAEPVFCR